MSTIAELACGNGLAKVSKPNSSGFSSIGFGTSKKQAKRHAAGALLERIVARNLTIPPYALESMEEENLSLVRFSYYFFKRLHS